MKLSTRTLHCLKNIDAPLDAEYIIENARELLKAPNFGVKSLAELAHWVFDQRVLTATDHQALDLKSQIDKLEAELITLKARQVAAGMRLKNLALLQKLTAEYPAEPPLGEAAAARASRNAEIIAKSRSGSTKVALSVEYGMTPNQIANIIKKTNT